MMAKEMKPMISEAHTTLSGTAMLGCLTDTFPSWEKAGVEYYNVKFRVQDLVVDKEIRAVVMSTRHGRFVDFLREVSSNVDL